MKCSELWLREWVNPTLNLKELANTLTMAGLEVEELAPVAAAFSGVVVGQVVKIDKHAEAERLQVCEVNVGHKDPLSIVCGATNVKVGMKVAVAMIDAALPNNITIKPTVIRGVASQGMLCSAGELGWPDDSQGILALSKDAPLGQDLRAYLQLEDVTIDISITPNRGDCLSVKGIAREVSALTATPLTLPISNKAVAASTQNTIKVSVESKAGCPRYVGRLIRQVKVDIETPIWLKERLRRSGVRTISPIVDVTNYVMLELGQPMHAFDLNTIQQGIVVRQAKKGEKIALLDGSEKGLEAEALVIADHEKPLAIAGVMGGLESSVTSLTRDIFLESAYFSPAVVARQRQYYGLNSDSAYRFERGVDSTIQREAIERATQLILDIVGGEPGPVIEVVSEEHLPSACKVSLPHEKITQILGISIPEKEVERIFHSLQMAYVFQDKTWIIDVPPYRSDIKLAEDIIEEIARLYGYDHIPTHKIKSVLQANQVEDSAQDLQALRMALCDQGYHEVISYSFVDKKLQALLDPDETPRELLNPMTADMAVMRTNLWPGLVNTLLYNKSRQQHRIRLFEIGTVFITLDHQLYQQQKWGGLMMGSAYQEQWGQPGREADFYDVKGSIENIFSLFSSKANLVFKPEVHSALHPGQTAGIYHKDQKVGIVGALHPTVLQALDLATKVFVFELDLEALQKLPLASLREVSKFPEIRRDIAILVNQAIPAEQIQDTIKTVAGNWLQNVFIFDVYQGKGISSGLKSIALALILQHPTRTLVDDEVAALMERIIVALKGQLGAELRS